MAQLIPNIYFLLFSFLSLSFILIWALIFHIHSSKKTPTKYLYFVPVLIGIGAALGALGIEIIVSKLLVLELSFLEPDFRVLELKNLINPLIFSFVFIAFIEEVSKFILIKKYLELKKVSSVVEGMKIGLWVGFGFVFIENIIYFFNFASYAATLPIISVFLIRGTLSTLAHGLYGVISSYYISLATFHKFYRRYFLRAALIASILLHGIFNFFLIINLGFYSVLLIFALLIIVLVWYNEKNVLVIGISRFDLRLNTPQFFTEKSEVEALLSKNKSPSKMYRMLLELFPHKRQ